MINHDHITIGTIVRYNDVDRITYAVIGIDTSNNWNPYRLLDMTDYTITGSDLRQATWQIIANSK